MKIRDYLNRKYGNPPDADPPQCSPREGLILNLTFPLIVNVSRDFDREITEDELAQLLLYNERRARTSSNPCYDEGMRILRAQVGL